jgi:hypothetical protein
VIGHLSRPLSHDPDRTQTDARPVENAGPPRLKAKPKRPIAFPNDGSHFSQAG